MDLLREAVAAVAVNVAIAAIGIAAWSTHQLGQYIAILPPLVIAMWTLLFRHIGRRMSAEIDRRNRSTNPPLGRGPT